MLKGKKGIIFGIANDHSIAWGIAKKFSEYDAELALLAYAYDKGLVSSDDADEVDDWLMTNVADKRAFNKLKEDVQERFGVYLPRGIKLKDFEVFITGGLLLKPNMNHMETWPDFYKKDKTYIGFNWNLNDLEETIQNILENYTNYISVAKQGQEHYKHYVESEEGRNEFVERFLSIIEA